MDEARLLAAFGSLSNATRLQILRELIAAGPSGLRAGELADAVGASPSRASFHLVSLSNARLVTSNRSSREVIYRADFDAVGAMMRFFLEDCCARNEQILDCCRCETDRNPKT